MAGLGGQKGQDKLLVQRIGLIHPTAPTVRSPPITHTASSPAILPDRGKKQQDKGKNRMTGVSVQALESASGFTSLADEHVMEGSPTERLDRITRMLLVAFDVLHDHKEQLSAVTTSHVQDLADAKTLASADIQSVNGVIQAKVADIRKRLEESLTIAHGRGKELQRLQGRVRELDKDSVTLRKDVDNSHDSLKAVEKAVGGHTVFLSQAPDQYRTMVDAIVSLAGSDTAPPSRPAIHLPSVPVPSSSQRAPRQSFGSTDRQLQAVPMLPTPAHRRPSMPPPPPARSRPSEQQRFPFPTPVAKQPAPPPTPPPTASTSKSPVVDEYFPPGSNIFTLGPIGWDKVGLREQLELVFRHFKRFDLLNYEYDASLCEDERFIQVTFRNLENGGKTFQSTFDNTTKPLEWVDDDGSETIRVEVPQHVGNAD